MLGNICFLHFKNRPWTYFHTNIFKSLAEEFYTLAKLWHIHTITYCVNTIFSILLKMLQGTPMNMYICVCTNLCVHVSILKTWSRDFWGFPKSLTRDQQGQSNFHNVVAFFTTLTFALVSKTIGRKTAGLLAGIKTMAPNYFYY